MNTFVQDYLDPIVFGILLDYAIWRRVQAERAGDVQKLRAGRRRGARNSIALFLAPGLLAIAATAVVSALRGSWNVFELAATMSLVLAVLLYFAWRRAHGD